MYDLGHVSWARSVPNRPCTAPQNGSLGTVDDLSVVDLSVDDIRVRRVDGYLAVAPRPHFFSRLSQELIVEDFQLPVWA